ncbi:unnamed protein product [Gadus morhua 'NCC']
MGHSGSMSLRQLHGPLDQWFIRPSLWQCMSMLLLKDLKNFPRQINAFKKNKSFGWLDKARRAQGTDDDNEDHCGVSCMHWCLSSNFPTVGPSTRDVELSPPPCSGRAPEGG